MVAGETIMTVSVERFYTPRRVEYLLKQLPVFYDVQTLEMGDLGVKIKLGRLEHNPIENRMIMMADLLSAIESLGYFQELVILACVVGGQPYREFAERHRVSIGHVSDVKCEAVRVIAYRLGWREPKRRTDAA